MAQKKEFPDFPKVMSIGFLEGVCNLACPKCPVYGAGTPKKKPVHGTMSLQDACKIFDELKGRDIVAAAHGFTEPLIQKDFWKYVQEMRKRDIRVSINTNGLLLDEVAAQKFIEYEVDCIFISIDAVTKETMKKMRGTDELQKVQEGVFHLLKARGDKQSTRIGVSFVLEDENAHERDPFVAYWTQHVDAVRVAEPFSLGKKPVVDEPRKPCPLLYDTMLIHYNGDVPICCWDGNGRTKMGNVFEEGVQGVWLNKAFEEARHFHETGQFDKIPYCKNCRDWPRNDLLIEEDLGDILVRRSALMTYYNRKDRMGTWHKKNR